MSKWPMVKLGEVCEKRISKWDRSDELNYVDISSVSASSKVIERTVLVEGESAPSRAQQILLEGDVLVSTVRPNLNAVARVPKSLHKQIGSTGFCVLRAGAQIDSGYLFYFTQTDAFIGECVNRSTGISYPSTTAAKIKEIKIPLPPLEEQKRIAGILEASARQLESLRNQIAALEKLRSQVIYEFSTSCSKFISLNEIAEVSTGATPLRKNKSYYEGTIPWVKTGEVVGSEITDTEEHISDLALKETNCRLFRAGTTLVAMYGQGATRGRAGFLSRDMATNQACAAITPIESADDRYVFNLVKASYEKLRASGRGGTQPNLNLKIVKSFEIPYPTDERLRLNLSATCMEVDTQIDALNKKTNLLQELHQSLATRAFAGEL